MTSACSSRFPSDLPSGRPVVHVDRSAPDGGDGTSGAPYNSIRNALGSAPAAAVLAVAAGRYSGPLNVRRDIDIVGACAEQVIVAPAASETAVAIQDATVRIVDVTIEGGRMGLTGTGSAAVVTLERVVITGQRGLGLVFQDGELSLSRVVMEDVHAVDGTLDGRCMAAQGGARVTLDNVTLRRCSTVGLIVLDGAQAIATDLVIEQVEPGPARAGFGAQARAARLTIQRGWVRGAPGSAINAFMGASLTLSDLLVEDGATAIEGDDSELTGTRIVIRRVTGVGVNVRRSTVELEDVVVAGVLSTVTGDGGRGVEGHDGAIIRLRRAVIADVGDVGILHDGELLLEDVLIRDARGRGDGAGFGRGISATGTPNSLRRVEVRDVREHGILLTNASDLEDVTIQNVATDSFGGFGHGLHIEDAAAVVAARRVSVTRAHGGGVVVLGGAFGATDLAISATEGSACTDSDCAAAASGVGLLVHEEGRASAERFVFEDSALAGAQLATGELDLSHGVVRGHVIGAAISGSTFDLGRIQNQVIYVDNDVNLDARTLPLPDVANALTE